MKEYQIQLAKDDYRWLLDRIESTLARAKGNVSVWCDVIPQIERVRDAIASAGVVTVEGDGPAEEVPPVKVRKKRGERLATLPRICSDHPAYGAVRSPRTDCDACWNAYERVQGVMQAQRAREILLKKKGKAGGR
jgi:hypothetical protein